MKMDAVLAEIRAALGNSFQTGLTGFTGLGENKNPVNHVNPVEKQMGVRMPYDDPMLKEFARYFKAQVRGNGVYMPMGVVILIR